MSAYWENLTIYPMFQASNKLGDLTGNLTLIRGLLSGEWNQDFLVIQPGQEVAMSYEIGRAHV